MNQTIYRVAFFLLVTTIPLIAEEEQRETSNPTLKTIKQVTDTVKGFAQAARDKTSSIITRTKEETHYFGQEIRSLFRTPQQILLKQKPDQVAQEYETFLITVILNRSEYQQWSSLVTDCNQELIRSSKDWYQLVESIYLKLRTALHEQNKITIESIFVPQLPINSFATSYLDEKPDNQTISITFVFQRPYKLYEWVEHVSQYMNFVRHIEQTPDLYHQLDILYILVDSAIKSSALGTICILPG